MPDPRDPDFVASAAVTIERVLRITRGRAFCLFTSYSQMRALYDRLLPVLDFPLLLHGTAPRKALLEEFRSTPNSVLFGTSSFWQGVDVQGEALSCVIIDRLPFAVPSDPVVQARMRAIEESGGRPFFDYQVPEAVLTLKQGFGRLIRSLEDRGVLVLLDPRITRQRYGQIFLQSLPPYRITQTHHRRRSLLRTQARLSRRNTAFTRLLRNRPQNGLNSFRVSCCLCGWESEFRGSGIPVPRSLFPVFTASAARPFRAASMAPQNQFTFEFFQVRTGQGYRIVYIIGVAKKSSRRDAMSKERDKFVDAKLAKMTLAEKCGQVLTFTWRGAYLTPSGIEQITKLHAGGLCLEPYALETCKNIYWGRSQVDPNFKKPKD